METRISEQSTAGSVLRLTAPAKINLTLEVLGRRLDGYHNLRSLMVPLELADEITIEPDPAGFSFICDGPGMGGDPQLQTEENLIIRALDAICENAFIRSNATGESASSNPEATAGRLPVKITLRKNIPTEAGLGGGSSDAAAILLAGMAGSLLQTCDTAPRPSTSLTQSSTPDWLTLARSLGSDVPFFLTQTGALIEGTGERVTAVGTLPDWHVIIVKPPVAMSTAAAYTALDNQRLSRSAGKDNRGTGASQARPRSTSVSLAALTALQRGDFDEVVSCLSNDFHDIIAAKEPLIVQAISALRAAGATNTLLAGSGSAVFSLTENDVHTKHILSKLSLRSDFTVYSTRFHSNSAWQ